MYDVLPIQMLQAPGVSTFGFDVCRLKRVQDLIGKLHASIRFPCLIPSHQGSGIGQLKGCMTGIVLLAVLVT
jgi:hypothetical protein